MLTQEKLKRYRELKIQRKLIENEIKNLENEIYNQLINQEPLEQGRLFAYITCWERKVISWKDEFIKACGEAKAKEVTEKAPTEVCERLIVKEIPISTKGKLGMKKIQQLTEELKKAKEQLQKVNENTNNNGNEERTETEELYERLISIGS